MTDAFLSSLKTDLDDRSVIDLSEDMAPYLVEWRGTYDSQAAAVVRPPDTEGVALTVRRAAQAGFAIVPMGGNTGLVGGAVAQDAKRQIILSTERLDGLRAIDADNNTITVGAGMILSDVQDKARDAGRLFPLSLGAESSCRIGGNLSTNAGGINVLRYGSARDLVLGLEVVLPDGQIWNGLRALRKNNTGYDLKHLFLGAEGTLGIITAAVLKLFPMPEQSQTVFAGLPSPAAALNLFTQMKASLGERVSAFELLPRRSLAFALKHIDRTRDPLAEPHDWYVLMEAASSKTDHGLTEAVEQVLGEAIEAGDVADAVIAQNETQAAGLWHLREAIVAGQKPEGASLKHDVSVPVSRVPEFIDRANTAVTERLPGIRPVAFGHLGDGNIHLNLSQPIGMDKEEYFALRKEFAYLVHDIVVDMDGSISAEHGVGLMKRDEIAKRKQPVEIELMRAVKRAFDPDNRMNPGKMISMDD
ncbi:MAG: FAD-binding oxidoreductase [Pseudomonadota bacterium]